MTRLSQQTEFQPGLKTRRIERLVAFGRGAVAWERIWPSLWPASGIAGLFLAAALFGLFAPLTWPLHALVLSGAITDGAEVIVDVDEASDALTISPGLAQPAAR